ncbi:MAG: hypothetical protein KBT10_02540, partial [Bacteroidales bacterium]|nr:hypothetical protein [Candidatus Sodaliphilus aphodohippi]
PYHALLTTIADYKAYRPATSDSAISIALEHYDRAGADPDKRMRSLLYRGCVAYELGNDTLAMRYYKLAQQRCPASDRFHQGYIHFRIAGLYKQYIECRYAILHLKKAGEIFAEIGDKHYELCAWASLGEAYTMNNCDSGYVFIDKSIRMAAETSDSSYIYQGRYNLSTYYYICKDNYRMAADIMKSVIAEGVNYIDGYSACYFTCLALAKLGKTDSAKMYFDMMPLPRNSNDSLQYLICSGILNTNQGDYNIGNKQVHRGYAIGDSITLSRMGGIMAQTELNAAAEAQRQDSHNKTLMLLWAVAGIVLLAIAVLFLHQRLRRHRLRMLAQNTDIDALKQQTESLLQQLAQLQQMPQDGSEAEQQTAKITELQEATDRSLKDFGEVIRGLIYTGKGGKAVKDERIAKLMDDKFFAQLRALVNARHDNLVTKLANGPYKLSEQDINIICLELCHFPNAVMWSCTNMSRLGSVATRKNIIAAKVDGLTNICDMPAHFTAK